MPNLGPMEILLIVFVVLLLFGSAKLPDLARSVGRSARIFKSEVNEMQKDGKKGDSAAAAADDTAQQNVAPQREITSGQQGDGTAWQKTAEQSFWNQPQNQQNPQPGSNPNA